MNADPPDDQDENEDDSCGDLNIMILSVIDAEGRRVPELEDEPPTVQNEGASADPVEKTGGEAPTAASTLDSAVSVSDATAAGNVELDATKARQPVVARRDDRPTTMPKSSSPRRSGSSRAGP